MQRKLSFLLASMLSILAVSVLSITSEQLQSHAENVQIIFDPIFGHNHNGTNSAKLAANSVNTTQIVDNSVTNSKIVGPISVAKGGTGLSNLGSANQILRVNSGGTALEYATSSSGNGQEGDLVHVLSKTIGDYSGPSSVTSSSENISYGSPTTVTIPDGTIITATADSNVDNRQGNVFSTGSIPVGNNISSVSFWLKKIGSPTGTAYGRIYDSSGSLVATFGSVDISNLTSSLVKTTFTTNRTVVAGDRFAMEYTGGADGNGLGVQYAIGSGHDGDLTRGTSYVTSWSLSTSGDDIKMEYVHRTLTTHSASRAIDGNTATEWRSNQENKPYLRLDLGSNKDIAQIAINLERTNTTATTLKIYSSTDTTFTSDEVIAYVNVSDFTDDTYRYILTNYSEDRRYILIEAQENNSVLAINEVKVRHTLTDWALKHFHAKRDVATISSFNDSN